MLSGLGSISRRLLEADTRVGNSGSRRLSELHLWEMQKRTSARTESVPEDGVTGEYGSLSTSGL